MRVVFDADDVLFECNEVLERLLKLSNPEYSMSKLKTYDFNKSLGDSIKTELGIALDDKTNGLGVEREYIMDILTSLDLFEKARPYKGVGQLLSDLSKKCELVIHTSACSEAVMLYKVRQLNLFLTQFGINATLTFSLINDVYKEYKHLADNGLRGVDFLRSGGVKQDLLCDVYVEDCLENLSSSAGSVYKILVDKPYNQFKFNQSCDWLMDSDRFQRVSDIYEAISQVDKFISTGVW